MSTLLPLHAKGITVRRRGKTLLGPLDLSLTEPGVTVVLGPNGAGKTTLLKALHGLERLNAGNVVWPLPEAEARARQAYVFQTPILLRRSVRGNLGYPLEIAGVAKAEVAKRVTAWANHIGLETALDRRASMLSGGEKQKLALARALIGKPAMLFLDEPCTNLDGSSTREIEKLITDARESGTAILLTTHDLGQAKRLADQVIFLKRGQIHERGEAKPSFETPKTPELAAFLRGDIIE